MKAVQAFLRQFEALATSFANKFNRDIFWRTQFVIIGTLFFLCFANILIVIYFSNRLHLEIASVVIGYVTNILATGSTSLDPNNATILDEIYSIRNTYLIFVGCISIIVTLLFGYVVARIALTPTKNALVSQKQFIGNIAHELRTPLSIVRANSEILSWETPKDSDMSNMIQSNLIELDKISSIINNLLTLNSFHHIEDLEFSYVDIGDVIQTSIQKYAKHIQNKNLTLDQHLKEKSFIWANQNAVEQIITNILKNAIAYTPQHGSIRIATSTKSDLYVVTEIADSGIGIETEKLNRIFEPFYQVDPSRSEALNSSGLGLAIVAELVKLHRGRIEIKSMFGKGTSVELSFPMEPSKYKKHIRQKIRKDNRMTLNFTELSE